MFIFASRPGQGFARYSTDEKWHVPHFEKMLYDQAQLAVVYTDAYLLTNDQDFARVASDILSYVSNDLSDPSGGFYRYVVTLVTSTHLVTLFFFPRMLNLQRRGRRFVSGNRIGGETRGGLLRLVPQRNSLTFGFATRSV